MSENLVSGGILSLILDAIWTIEEVYILEIMSELHMIRTHIR